MKTIHPGIDSDVPSGDKPFRLQQWTYRSFRMTLRAFKTHTNNEN